MTTNVDTAAREAAFQRHLAHREAYNAAIIERGDVPKEPWHGGDIEVQRELFMRRYDRPAPPDGLSNSLNEIRGAA